MFRSAAARQSDLAMHRLAAHQESWQRSAGTWFDGTPDSIDNRITRCDHILAFARDTATRLGSTEAGRFCASRIPSLEQTRRELAAARDSLLNGFSDRQDASRPAGRRTAKPGTAGPSGVQPDDPRPGEKGAPSFAEYRGKCTECGSDNVDHAYGPHSGEYDCSDCGATFHPKVRRLKSSAPPSLVRAIMLGSRDFVADANTDDRDELLYRARRYAAEETSTLPTSMARQISAAFVGKVEELIANRPRIRQASRPITAYEDFDDSLIY